MQAMEFSYEQVAQDLQGSNVRVAKYQADIDREYSASKFGLQSFPTIVMLPKGGAQIIKYPSERRDPNSLKMWIRSVAGNA